MKNNDIVRIQIYYEIAMSIGNSLDLNTMLKESLSIYLKKLGCPAGMILITEKEDQTYHFKPLLSIPSRVNKNSVSTTILKILSGDLYKPEFDAFLKELPLTEKTATGRHYHIMTMGKFGLIVLIRGSSPLDYSIIRSLEPLNDKLASACATCLQNQEIKKLKQSFEKSAITDRLTGAMNRQFFDVKLEEEIERHRRLKTPFSIIMIDIDDFKKINDEYGHQMGDRVLVEISRCIIKTIRTTDFFVRWGGEEFIVMALTSLEGTQILAEKLRKIVESCQLNPAKGITASFGVAEYESGMSAERIVALADKAMYRAKKRGKNCVECSPRSDLSTRIS